MYINYQLPATLLRYCTISCIYAAACSSTAVAVCRTIIKRPLGVFSALLQNLGHYQSKKSAQTHTCWPSIRCVYCDYDYDYVIVGRWLSIRLSMSTRQPPDTRPPPIRPSAHPPIHWRNASGLHRYYGINNLEPAGRQIDLHSNAQPEQ